MLGKDQWMNEYEQVCEQFEAGVIDQEGARAELKRLGFDPDEIDEHISALTE